MQDGRHSSFTLTYSKMAKAPRFSDNVLKSVVVDADSRSQNMFQMATD